MPETTGKVVAQVAAMDSKIMVAEDLCASESTMHNYMYYMYANPFFSILTLPTNPTKGTRSRTARATFWTTPRPKIRS